MKKYLIILALVLPIVTSAQTTNSTVDLQALIQQLQTQVQSLRAQIVDLKAEVQSVKLELKFSRALAQGSTGDDVKQLQEFLKNFTGAYPDGLVTGYYGPLTATAVKKFQEQNGIESVGVVGPKTQEKLNVLVSAIPATPTATTDPVTSSGQNQTSATAIPPAMANTPGTSAVPYSGTEVRTLTIYRPVTTTGIPCKTPSDVQTNYSPTVIKVLSPNGGEEWQMGEFQTIKYSAENLGSNKALLIYLEKGHDVPTTKTTPNSSQLIGVTTNLESYTYKLNQVLPAGNNYKITVYAEGSYSSCDVISYIGDSSDATFSIVPGQSPAVSTIRTFPTTSTTGGGYGAQAVSTQCGVTSASYSDEDECGPGLYKNVTVQCYDGYKTKLGVGESSCRSNNTWDQYVKNACVNHCSNKIIPGTVFTGGEPSGINNPANKTPTNTVGNGYLTTEEKMANIQAEINKLQNQLDTTTDTTLPPYLSGQITALKGQLQIVPLEAQISTLSTKLEKATDDETKTSLRSQMDALKAQVAAILSQTQLKPIYVPAPAATWTSQEEMIADMQTQISAYQNKLDNTTDASARDSLTAQITALVQEIQSLISQGQLLPTATSTPVSAPSVNVSPTTNSQAITGIHEPSVVVLFPNGGETFTIGKIYNIKWTGGNDIVDVYLLDDLTRL